MKEIITDLTLLGHPAEPLTFITEGGIEKDEVLQIIADLTEVFEANKDIIALSAPQIGIKKRIFGIRFDDQIKFFINPVVTKKNKLIIAPETLSGLADKEILIGRPEELAAVYYTGEFKYEDNKFLGAAARIFDQQAQLLDGILPTELGLVSDINEDGPLSDLSEEEIAEVTELYKKFITTKTAKLKETLMADEDAAKIYKSLHLTEEVINGRIQVIQDSTDKQKYMANKTNKIKNNAQLSNFLRRN